MKRISFICLLFQVTALGIFAQIPAWDWVISLHSGSLEIATDVAADPITGDVYMVGYWHDDLSDSIPYGGTPSTDFSSTYGGEDGVVAKFSASGNLLWAFKVGGDGNDLITAIHLDQDGNFYITGSVDDGDIHFAGTASLTPDSSYTNIGKNDFFLSKYDSDGRLLWNRHSEGSGEVEGRGICSNASGVYVTGTHKDLVSFGLLPPYSAVGEEDLFIVKYTTDGDAQWHVSGGSNKRDYGEDITCDESRLYVVGEFAGDQLDLTNPAGDIVDSLVNSNGGKAEIVVASYSLEGDLEWSHSVQSQEDDFCFGISADSDSLYLAGSLGAEAQFPAFAGNPVSHVDKQDAFLSSIAKSNGATGWVATLTGESGDEQEARDISIDFSGNLYVTGYFKNTIHTPAGNMNAVGSEDIFVVSYTPEGVFKWIKTAGSNSDDFGNGISAAFSGNICVAGDYKDDTFFDALLIPGDGNRNLYTANLQLPCVDAAGGTLWSSDSVVCESDSVTLFLDDYLGSLQWQTSPPGMNDWSSFTPDTADSITFVPVAPADYRAHLKSGSCAPDSSNVVFVQVHPTPGASISGDSIICDDGSTTLLQVELTGSPPWDLVIRYNGISDTLISGIITTPYFHQVSQAGTYTLVSVSDSNCEGKVSGSASLNYYPAASAYLEGDTSLCELNPVSLHLILTGDGPWDVSYSDSASITTIPGIASPSYDFLELPVQTTNYFLTDVTDVYGCHGAISGEALVHIESVPVPDPGTGGDVCGFSFALQATPGVDTGFWSVTSGPGTAIFTPDSTDPAAMVTVSDSGYYEFTWTEIRGICSSDSSVWVSFAEPLPVDPGYGGLICGPDFALQAVPGVGSGYWAFTSGPGTVTFTPDSTDPAALATVTDFGTYVFTWSETDGLCSGDSSVTVRFFEPPVIAVIPGDSICGLEFMLDATSNIDVLGAWTTLSGPGNALFLPDQSMADAIVQVDDYGNYTFQWTAVNAICAQSASVDVSFLRKPDVDAGPDTTIEIGEIIQLHGTGGDSVIWIPDYRLNDPQIWDPFADPQVTTTYHFLAYSMEGCFAEDSVVITVAAPDFARAGEDVSICPGDSIQLQASGGDLYAWDPAEGLDLPGIPDPWVKPRSTTSYMVNVTRPDGVTDRDTVTVTVLPRPYIDAGDSQSVCQGEPVQLSATGTGTFRWLPSVLFPDPSLPEPVVTPDTTTTFLVRIADSDGCRNADSVTVIVYPPPIADAGPDQELIAWFETSMEAHLASHEMGLWTLVSGQGVFESPQSPDSRVTGLEIGDNIFSWHVSNGVCPEVSDQVIVRVEDFVIPTVITPNGDGKNDYFHVEGIQSYSSAELVVLNRWGEEVYRSSPYQNDWDGTNQGGKALPEDTYFIVLQLNSNKIRKGYVMILR